MTAVFYNKTKKNSQIKYWREILALLMLLLAVVFFRSERKDLDAIVPHLRHAIPYWLLLGFCLTIIYITLQGGIYKKCFSSIGLLLNWKNSFILFLKRNFIGVFLPAGGVSALAYSPSEIRRSGFSKIRVHQASALFGFTGLLTIFIAGLPVILFTILYTYHFTNAWIGLALLLLLVAILVIATRSIFQKGRLYLLLTKKIPSITPLLDELFDANVNKSEFSRGVTYSMGVELCGMLHIYIAMLALGLPASFGASASAYIIAVLMMIGSPFLKGLGAVELSMVYVLDKFGYSSVQAISVTLLYRVFEFWLPLLIGFIVFAWKGRKLFLRLAPALLTFALGVVNIISAITPPIRQRTHLLREYIPLTVLHGSALLILFIGLFLLLNAASLFRGLRNAWAIALVLSIFSLLGHLTKALDYEEAAFAFATCLVLISTSGQYYIRSSSRWIQAGLKTAMLSFLAVLLFGFISFYFIDVRHFGIDFTWQQSLVHTFKIFLLVQDDSLLPVTRFGREFVSLIRCLGFFTWGFLIFTIIKPHKRRHTPNENHREKAMFLLTQFGNSPVDYFKTYKDKLFFISATHDAFIAYRIAGGFAIVLEMPVCSDEYKMDVLREFESHCRQMGLKPAFYRIDENSLPWFNQLRKQKLVIGQEAILDINRFDLEGREKKSLRNGLNSLTKKGYTVVTYAAPHSDMFLAQLKTVSDEWLESFQKAERIFSQGMFDKRELKQQPIIALHDAAGNLKAFLNIIPDYAEDECTYDLIRKTNDAPAAAMDALIVKLTGYAKEHGKQFVNLGMVPMTGITQPANTAEEIMKLAVARIKRFRHYKGLQQFKEKYAAFWETKYLVYDNDFDLLRLPLALNNVMKP